MPAVLVKCSSKGCFPAGTPMVYGLFAKFSTSCFFCFSHHEVEPTAALAPADDTGPAMPPANTDASPTPVATKACRRENRGWVIPRQNDGSIALTGTS